MKINYFATVILKYFFVTVKEMNEILNYIVLDNVVSVIRLGKNYLPSIALFFSKCVEIITKNL